MSGGKSKNKYFIFQDTFIPDLNEPPISYSTPFYPNYSVPNTKPIHLDDNKLVNLPDRRAYRSMSRTALMMARVGLNALETIKPFLKEDPFSVGIYAATENGPTEVSTVQELARTSAEDFGQLYRKARSPKSYLKQLPNLASAQLGIFLGTQGPLNVYTHGDFSALHALDQACFDLIHYRIEAALVIAGQSFEDPLVTFRWQREALAGGEPIFLSEGAACLVLNRDNAEHYMSTKSNYPASDFYDMSSPYKNHFKRHFWGIAQPLMHIAFNHRREK